MNVLLRPGRALAALASVAFLGLTLTVGALPRADAFPGGDPRYLWAFDQGDRTIKYTGGGKWAEYEDGRLKRVFVEQSRNTQFIEIYTDDPQPTWVRLHSSRVYWRTTGETVWRQGRTGGWVDP